MIITNKKNLPKPVYDMVVYLLGSHPKMRSTEFSVTELEKGTKELILMRRYGNEIEVDIADLFNVWEGLALHEVLKHFADESDSISEKRFKIDMGTISNELQGITVSGSMDRYEKDTCYIKDYKSTKVATYNKARTLKDKKFLYQLMFYKRILNQHGYEVKGLENICMLKDFSKPKAKFDSSYPQDAVQTIDYTTVMEDPNENLEKEVEEFFKSKVISALVATCMDDDEIPPCTQEERMEDVRWSVQKAGAKRATKNFDTEAEALEALQSYGEGFEVVKKGGEPVKCEMYCMCNKYCNFYKNYKKEQGEQV